MTTDIATRIDRCRTKLVIHYPFWVLKDKETELSL